MSGEHVSTHQVLWIDESCLRVDERGKAGSKIGSKALRRARCARSDGASDPKMVPSRILSVGDSHMFALAKQLTRIGRVGTAI